MSSPSSSQGSSSKKRKNDGLSKALQDLPNLLTKREQELDERESLLERERLAFEAEKAEFFKHHVKRRRRHGADVNNNKNNGSSGDEHDSNSSNSNSNNNGTVLHLNVGGTRMDVLRRTLTSVEGSMLASRFSGRWDESLERDDAGYFFIDQRPRHFEILLNILRDRMNERPGSPPPRSPDVQTFDNNRADFEAFVRMINYYEMSFCIWPTRIKRRRGNPSASRDGISCPTAFYPQVEIASPTTPLFNQLTPQHHHRYPQAFEIMLLDNRNDFTFGWAFRTNDDANAAAAAFGAPAMAATQLQQHSVTIDCQRGMLKMDQQNVVRVNNGLPLPTEDRCILRAEIKRSVFYFYANGKEIANFPAFRPRILKKPTPVMMGTGRWRIVDLVLEL